MTVLVTGSSGHLGEGLMRAFEGTRHRAVGLDLVASPFTRCVGSITDRDLVRRCMRGVDAVIHTATLHKSHVATHSRQDFVDTNVTGTLTLLEEAVAAGAGTFVFTSTTSAFGGALTPPPDAPAAWVTEDTRSIPRNRRTSTSTVGSTSRTSWTRTCWRSRRRVRSASGATSSAQRRLSNATT